MTKFKIADLPEADYNLRDSIERKFRGQVKFESTEQSLNTLFWYPPSGLGGWVYNGACESLRRWLPS